MLVWKAQILHVAAAELDVLQLPAGHLAPSDFEQAVGEIDRDYPAVWPDLLSGRNRRRAGAAPDVEDICTGLECKPLDGAPTIFCPETERLVVEVIRRGVISRRRLDLDRIRDRLHRTLRSYRSSQTSSMRQPL